jgi:outer membrane biosynthesis protein TonB
MSSQPPPVRETVASKEGQKLSLQLESMRIPKYESWFPATFGTENGARLAGAAAMLLNKVHPIYSLEARRQRVSGVVRLHAIIATDGSIKQLEAVSEDALPVQAALDAVRQWRYRPTTLE